MKYLYTSTAWLLCVMDRMAGGDACIFPTLEKSSTGTKCLVSGSFQPGSALIMISACNSKAPANASETISFRIPTNLMDTEGASIRFVRLNRENSVYDRMRNEFAAANVLKKLYVDNPGRLGDVREMGEGRPAEILVDDHRADYERQWIDSLTLKTFDPSIGTIERQADGITLRVKMSIPEVLVLAVQTRTMQRGQPASSAQRGN